MKYRNRRTGSCIFRPTVAEFLSSRSEFSKHVVSAENSALPELDMHQTSEAHHTSSSSSKDAAPRVSVVISNKNGVRWLPKCLESVRAQTIADRIEIIIVDNVSTDESVPLARKLVAGFPQATIIENKEDLGFTGGMNTGAFAARGEGVFLLSNDAWMENDCLEKLVAAVDAAKADGGMPLVLNYEDSSLQSLGADGIDLFGLSTTN